MDRKAKVYSFYFTGIVGGLATLVFAAIWLLTARNWGANNDNNSPSYFWLNTTNYAKY
ncbi:hypothetical protein [Parafilimonas sp.]|uniref:hypothetical protein n=1 Tax=Parafilimonas sp. TaxID=1969739 RepID=UPI0039E3E005